MKPCSCCKQLKSTDNFSKSKARNDGLNVYCRTCISAKQKIANAKYKAKHPGRDAERMRNLRKSPEYVAKEREYGKQRYWNDVDNQRKRVIAWRQANPAKVKAARNKYWLDNPGSRNASRMKRYANKKQATPAWTSDGYMKLWYQLAKVEEKRTGQVVEVDHIIPLQSEYVCGLHNEDNMQLLFRIDNRQKQNYNWPQMWHKHI